MSQPYTEQDVQRIIDEFGDTYLGARHVIEHVLDAAHAAGYRLLPPGGRTEERWGVRVRPGGDPDEVGSRREADAIVASHLGEFGRTIAVVQRTATWWPDGSEHFGPWTDAPAEETPDA